MNKKVLITGLIFWVLVMTSSSFGGHNLLTNGDFETGWAWDPNINYWTPWWWNTDPCVPKNIDIGDHTANYGENPPVNEDAAVFWAGNGWFQDIKVVPGARYEFGGSMINGGAFPLDLTRAVIKAEVGDINDLSGPYWWAQEIDIDESNEPNVWFVLQGDTIINDVNDSGIPVGATRIRISLLLFFDETWGTGHAYFDDVWLRETGRSADFNVDGSIDFLDFAELAGVWKQTSVTYDLVGNDDFIDEKDLEFLLNQWLWEH